MNRPSQIAVQCLTTCLLMATASIATAQTQQPKAALGIGVGSQLLADYRGSDYYQFNAIPIPYVQYRGKFLESDREGVRGKFFSSDRLEFNLSADAALTNDSADNKLREGMPQIHPSFELGPSLNIKLQGDSLKDGLSLRLAARGVFAYDNLAVDYVGWLLNPELAYRKPDLWGNYAFGSSLGVLYADKRYQDYYYGVAPAYQTANRNAFASAAGYNGAYLKIGISRRIGQWWLGSYLRYDNLQGMRNADSPMVESYHSFSVGLAATWIFWESKTKAAE